MKIQIELRENITPGLLERFIPVLQTLINTNNGRGTNVWLKRHCKVVDDKINIEVIK